MIPILEIDQQGNISTLYNDDLDLYELGLVTRVRRASFIEFNEKKQWWEVIDVVTKEVVYQNKVREKCIEWEINAFSPGGKYYNEN
jgi:3-methyladenine DNA glycosylase AlkD